MSNTQTRGPLTLETLKNRNQLNIFERSLQSIVIDPTVVSKLLLAGSRTIPGSFLFKLRGYYNQSSNTVHVKDVVGMPMLPDGQGNETKRIEQQETQFRVSLGFEYKDVGIFVITENGQALDMDLLFYMAHLNVFEGLCVCLVYNKQTSELNIDNPLSAHLMSENLNECFEYKEERGYFEANPKLLEEMTKNGKQLLTQIPLKIAESAILDLIIERNQIALKSKNNGQMDSDYSRKLLRSIEGGLSKMSHGLFQALGKGKSHEARREALVAFNTGLENLKKQLEGQERLNEKESKRIDQLQALANEN